MTDQGERVEMISQAIRLQAKQQAADIVKNADACRDEELAHYNEELIEEIFTLAQKDVDNLRQESIRSVAQAARDSMISLIRRRREITDSVFSEVRGRLLSYAATPEYQTALLEEISELAGAYEHTATVVVLREEDIDLADKIGRLLPGCAVRADESVRLGGFFLENTAARILIDQTLERRLAEQREWFLQSCGLRIR